MQEKIEEIKKQAEEKIKEIKSSQELQDFKVKMLGKKSELSSRSFCVGLHLHAHRRAPPQRSLYRQRLRHGH